MQAAEPNQRTRKRWITAVQVVLTLCVFGYLFAITDVKQLADALEKAPWYSIPATIVTLIALLIAAAVRWRLLFSAYGAARPPRIPRLFRLQLIGLFYNLLPGAVGGDVVRGVASRDAFGERGMSAGIALVLIDRILGVTGLMALVLIVLSARPIAALHLPLIFLWLGIGAGLCAIAGLALGRRLAPWLPGKLRDIAQGLPELSHPLALLGAFGVSLINQAMVGVIGHITVSPLAPEAHLLDSFVLAPISFAAIFFPFTVAGAGTRDAAMIALYGLIGVPKSLTLLASLEILFSYLAVAAVGGVIAATGPIAEPAPSTKQPA